MDRPASAADRAAYIAPSCESFAIQYELRAYFFTTKGFSSMAIEFQATIPNKARSATTLGKFRSSKSAAPVRMVRLLPYLLLSLRMCSLDFFDIQIRLELQAQYALSDRLPGGLEPLANVVTQRRHSRNRAVFTK
jgi:hypothetical protein